jgi:hypothetical protein
VTSPPGDRIVRRWRKTPAEAEADLIQLLEHFRRQHDADPAEAIEEIFVTIGDLLTGFCRPDASWSESVEERTP